MSTSQNTNKQAEESRMLLHQMLSNNHSFQPEPHVQNGDHCIQQNLTHFTQENDTHESAEKALVDFGANGGFLGAGML